MFPNSCWCYSFNLSTYIHYTLHQMYNSSSRAYHVPIITKQFIFRSYSTMRKSHTIQHALANTLRRCKSLQLLRIMEVYCKHFHKKKNIFIDLFFVGLSTQYDASKPGFTSAPWARTDLSFYRTSCVQPSAQKDTCYKSWKTLKS